MNWLTASMSAPGSFPSDAVPLYGLFRRQVIIPAVATVPFHKAQRAIGAGKVVRLAVVTRPPPGLSDRVGGTAR